MPPLQVAVVQALPSSAQLPGTVQGSQPGVVLTPQMPPLQVAVVQALPSSAQLPGTVQGSQPGVVLTPQMPPLQVAVVQALPSSLQSPGTAQGSQPAIGECEQPSAPLHASTVQGLACRRGCRPRRPGRRKSLSMPSQSSMPFPVLDVEERGRGVLHRVHGADGRGVHEVRIAAAGIASAVMVTVAFLLAARVGNATRSGFVDVNMYVAPGSSLVTPTATLLR